MKQNERKKKIKKRLAKIVKTVYRILLPVLGLICIIASKKVILWLPAALGGIMILTGLGNAFFDVKDKKYLDPHEIKASSLILTVMGICFILGGEQTIPLMGITWGLLGLQEVNEELKEILSARSQKLPWKKKGICTLFKLILSLALIFEPLEKFRFHIVLLGIEIIIVTLKGSDIVEYIGNLQLKFRKNPPEGK